MALTRGAAKRPRSTSAGGSNKKKLPIESGEAPPTKRRAAPIDDADYGDDSEANVASGDDDDDDDSFSDEEGAELTPEEFKAAVLSGEIAEDEEDIEEDIEEWEDVDEDDEAEAEYTAPLMTASSGFTADPDNVRRFWERIMYIIVTIKRLVMNELSSKDFFPSRRNGVPITAFWYIFLCKVEVNFLLNMYRDGNVVPIQVQHVLGQKHFDFTDLLQLVGDWRDASWGVYLNILTKITDPDWYRLYVGSATAKGPNFAARGFRSRIGKYYGWVRNRLNPERQETIRKNGEHGRAVLDPDVDIQFVKLALFSYDTPKVYIHFWETVMMILLQTFKSKRISTWAPKDAHLWAEMCQPEDIDDMTTNIGLNSTWTWNQLSLGRPTKDRVCCNCGSSKTHRWFNFNPMEPFMRMLCKPCYRYRKDHGKLMDKEKATLRMRRCVFIADRVKKGEDHCDVCSKTFDPEQRKKKGRNYMELDGNQYIVCKSDYQRQMYAIKRGMHGLVEKNIFAPKSAALCVKCAKPEKACTIDKTDGKSRCLSCKSTLQKALKKFRSTGKLSYRDNGKMTQHPHEQSIIDQFSKSRSPVS
ncbi:hypothetical protein G7Y79_00037g073220 [Physcia stellaris]|nr:hypothetical protein G7Y79_00037g073220 [Physcia stellaris]